MSMRRPSVQSAGLARAARLPRAKAKGEGRRAKGKRRTRESLNLAGVELIVARKVVDETSANLLNVGEAAVGPLEVHLRCGGQQSLHSQGRLELTCGVQ